MAGPLIECVPNFSEGRNIAIVEAIEQAVRSAGAKLLRSEMDPDHNRSVITFAASPGVIEKAALAAVTIAVERIDLRQHSGVHPRIGAADVVPFVPLEGASLKDCAAIAHRVGRLVWETLHVPVYFYEAAATDASRAPLENVRRGGFEHPVLLPDLGGPALHPTAGGCAIGARKLLVAFNVNLNSENLTIAQGIARKIRASSGGLPFLKAMGVPLPSRNLVQVSMNLTDFEQTPLHKVYDAVRFEAARCGVEIAGHEIVGLVPRKALDQFPIAVATSQVLEDALADR